ncbi:DAO-domain-containing protein [Aspergillus heteromorphus CBS 117.55]|uniref:DAO-domain-containing protein n=1 Tax=Aspergillus heteromorphus CBS 117.55 TaxID=1448321 RepID=A0A317VJ14_9EURO|nr:DAO-domain-containing protein [Aspergillus heteromorphus CBS 117.55]PWY73028.1 DAO-domain-containing protein [Aspergillus heteromorphus CBS 117.55]
MTASPLPLPAPPAAAVEPPQPSLPCALPGLSHWHRTTHAFPYLNHNAETPLPARSPLVIIGTGISGALAAFKLVDAGVPPDEILLLEARQAVGGSSGRNAGHVRPDAFRGFSGYAAAHGTAQALKISDNENAVLKAWGSFIEQHQIPCEFSLKQTYDVCMTEEIAADEARNVQEYVAAGGSMDGIRVYGADEAARTLGIKDAVAAYAWTAASIHPVKLAQWLLARVVEQGVHLWTHCPEEEEGIDTPWWTVHTPRGDISAQRILHCTNAHAGVLLPQLPLPHITPIRVQVQTFILPNFAGDQALKSTMAVRFNPQLFYGLSQAQSDGKMIVSVGKPSGISFDDSSYKQELIDETLDTIDKVFHSPEMAKSKREFQPGEGLDHVWTGLIAMTPDKVPYVGAIEELPGQFICAGFNGHGMANIFTCVEGLVTLLQGGGWEETRLPECYRYEKRRAATGKEQ